MHSIQRINKYCTWEVFEKCHNCSHRTLTLKKLDLLQFAAASDASPAES